MINEGMALLAGTLCSIVPYHRRHAISLRQLRIIFKVILLEGLLTRSRAVYAAELTHIYRYTLGNIIDIYFFEHLLQVSLIVACNLS